ncbi:MAG TPA: hypothetical protein VGR92_21105 [Steroidobacteraceae bacterium]|nr:hypothetical protein [Steroidobacteraceae bacterium]
MKPIRNLSVCLLSGMAALAMLSTAVAATPSPAKDKNVTVTLVNGMDLINGGAQAITLRSQQMSLTSFGPTARMNAQDQDRNERGLPLFVYNVLNAGRDGLNHTGAIVGTNPFEGKRTSRIPVVIVPMIITTHTVATGLSSAGIFSTAAGDATQNSGVAQSTCLTAPNNVPSTLIDQSPIFQNAPFNFGGVFMGNTQYIDAVQRGEFYQALGQDPDNYHVLFSPVRIISPVTVDVPANEGIAADVPGDASSPNIFGTCGTVQFLDLNWFDSYINGTLLPQLAQQGIGADTIPVFFLYNTNLASPVTDLNTCCVLGYHSFAGEPKPNQTYAVAEIDVSGLFPTGIENTAVLAHEMGELVNDPYGDNEVPPWGHIGQVGGCQENLEVGDPLTGTAMPPVTMPNGFTYQLQELAFFSWFFGGQSLGVNGWFSSNGSFTMDAGPLCGA